MAGEIQLNSTTMATESSGSITAQLDTIRPNTTNGSLTLQGDSSDAGVTGLTIDSSGNATFAQTISGGTLGSSVVFPANMVLNVWSASKTDAASTTSTSFTSTGITELSITVSNPKSTSSKFLVSFTVYVSQGTYRAQMFRLMRGATPIGVGDSDGSRTQATAYTGADYGGEGFSERNVTCLSNSFLDSPATTSSTTYSLEWGAINQSTEGTAITINKTYTDSNDANHARVISTITVMEIQG